MYLKAVVAALVAGLGSLGVGLEDGSLNGTEVVAAIAAFLVALAAVYTVPNTPPPA